MLNEVCDTAFYDFLCNEKSQLEVYAANAHACHEEEEVAKTEIRLTMVNKILGKYLILEGYSNNIERKEGKRDEAAK